MAVELAARLSALWTHKLALTVGVGFATCVPYFLVQRYIFFPVTVMRPTRLDDRIPFSHGVTWIYLSFFPLVVLVPWLMVHPGPLYRFGLGATAVTLAACAVYFFWPTEVPRPPAEGTGRVYRAMTAVDAPRNAFPSIHATLAVYTLLGVESILADAASPWPWRATFILWTGLIGYSTLATKQHYLPDILAGAALGLLGHVLAFQAGY